MFKNRKNNKKGFTLVEVIVVLVILAILAAIMIPALTGYIDKANKKTAVVEGRTVLLALQTEIAENYTPGTTGNIAITASNTGVKVGDVDVSADFEKLVDVKDSSKKLKDVTTEGSKITGFKYQASSGYPVTYGDGKFTVADK